MARGHVPAPAALRAFVRRHTRLQPMPDVAGLRLHLADDVTTLWRLTGEALRLADPPLPYWAFAWSGGLAIARYLLDRPEVVEGRRVIDVGAGSGLCGIVAARAGAESVHAFDVDPFAAAAVALNAAVNGVRVSFSGRDVLGALPPPCDVVLAGDVSYEERMAGRMTVWLRAAAASGAEVLLGDPGRRYLAGGLEPLATYRVAASREIEEASEKRATVFRVTA